MHLATLKALNDERRARRAAILLTDLTDGSDRVVREGEAVDGELGAAIARAFRTGMSAAFAAGNRSWFLNAHLPAPRLVVIGAVHISQALAPMALLAGFDMQIIDPRTGFATRERFPDVPVHAEWPEDVLSRTPFDAWTAVAALTHDSKIDDLPLKQALAAGCFYVGALGSRKTHAKRVERLLGMGVEQSAIDRIRAPIGLDIGASTPAEIAVAVLAQVVGALRTRDLGGAGKGEGG